MRDVDGQKLTERQRYWLEHLRACEKAGKTMQAYAIVRWREVRACDGAKKRVGRRVVLAPSLTPARAPRPHSSLYLEVLFQFFRHCHIFQAHVLG